SLEIERGPTAGARRALPPPEAALVIGRGDEASWVILDEDLSRTHAEIRRGWDGVTVVDLGSKNGTRVDGKRIGGDPALLRDGAAVALGGIVMRFRDPAERHLRGEPPAQGASSSPAHSTALPPELASSAWPIVVYAAIAGLALAALVWILAS
ncbi:MAG TPA: FHA domain-containing protein, partial [Kofleriaceae bacterium]